MTHHRLLAVLSTLALLHATNAFAQSDATPDREHVSVTVYNNDLGVVRDVRAFAIAKGLARLELRDVPSHIDPTTVRISALEHPNDLAILEQNYEYDLVSQEKLLSKYIDKTITLTDGGRPYEATLLAVEQGKLTVRTPNGIEMLASSRTLTVPTLADGLITRPTLVWLAQSRDAYAREPLEVLYQTSGLTWHAEYIATLADDDRSLDLGGWVSVNNTSGATYRDAKLKLVAGAVHRATPAQPLMMAARRVKGEAMTDIGAPQFEERGMFEYHLYDLSDRTTTLANNEFKQISLLSARSINTTKRYVYEGGSAVAVELSIENSEASHLGMPLPMGTVRVMKRDKDGSLEFVGEDRIEHTPRDEKVTLHVGNAFDLTGSRELTASQQIAKNTTEETIAVTVKDHKQEDVTIDVVEDLGMNWEITTSSLPFEKKNASTVIFHTPVKARGETKVTYTVRRHWND